MAFVSDDSSVDGNGGGARSDEGFSEFYGRSGIGIVEETYFCRDGFGNVAREGGDDVACSFRIGEKSTVFKF